jgi:hypothetical protein
MKPSINYSIGSYSKDFCGFSLVVAITLGLIDCVTYAATTSNAEENYGVAASVQVGAGVYQDIQLPSDQWTNVRADGSAPTVEQVNHYGLPVRLELGKIFTQGQWVFATALSYLRIDALIEPQGSSESSYSQAQAGLFSRYRFTTGNFLQEGSFGGEFRRIAFMNISTGHLVDAMLPTGSWTVSSGDRWSLQAQGAKSVLGIVRYDTGKGVQHGEIKGSSASVAEVSMAIRRRISKDVWLNLGVMEEDTIVDIQDINRYDQFNLTVARRDDTSRHYELNTQTVTIGFDKNF